MSRKQKLQYICQRFIANEWLWLLLILPMALFPTPTRFLALLFLPILWMIRRLGQRHFVPTTPVDWLLFSMLLMVGVSLYATFDMVFSLGKIAGMIYGVAVFYAVVAYARQSTRHLFSAVTLLLLMGFGLVVLGLLGTEWTSKFAFLQIIIDKLPAQLLLIPGKNEGFSPNQLAGVLLFITPLALILTMVVFTRRKRLWQQVRPYQAILIALFLMGVTLATGGLLILTQSRASLFGLIVGLMFMGAVVIWQKNRLLMIISLLAVVIGLGFYVANGQGLQVIEVLFDQAGLEVGSNQINTLSGRLEIWSRAIYGIQDFPFTGMGMNNFRRVVPILYPLFLIAPDVDIAHAHNHLLQAALDLGMPGLIAYLALWLAMAAMLWQSWKQANSPWLKGMALGMAGSLLAHFVYGMLDVVALGSKPGLVFWFLAGLVISLHGIVRESETAVASNQSESV